ncbi:Ferric reduction oxidase 4 [Glycine max]|nr:Ferric reduction oxidase 4 [Glycine max]
MRSHTFLRITSLLVFIGWLTVWILLPTKVYKNTWTPKLKTKLNSTYFREQGTNLLLFTFPVMLIGALSCIYLHLHEKGTEKLPSKSGGVVNRWLCFLRRPFLVMSPIGIVTSMEIIFALMFVALLIWSLSNYLHTSFGHLHMHKEGEKVWQAKFRSVSLRLGYIGNICWAFLFFPVTRGSSILPLVGLTSESSIKYHIWLGHLSNVLFAAHTVGFFIYWGITHQMKETLEWSKTYVSNVAGVIAILIALVMWVTSFPGFRRKMYEVFFYTHHLYTLYILFYAMHVGVEWMCMISPGIFLFLIDRHLRFLQSRQCAPLLSARLLPCGALELNFSKNPSLYYNPTSMVFINVPKISKLQWHPFTVISSCNMETDILSVAVKTGGSWSNKLYQELSSSALDHLNVSVEGPYGPTTTSQFLRYKQLVLVSGGSGITPFISIIRDLIFQNRQEQESHVPKVLLVCAFKNSADLTMLDLLLPLFVSTTQFSNLHQLQIEAYITREKEEAPRDSQKQIQTKWFKPILSDSPISLVLGPNNWLWLGAIISSSFLMFLLLLGIITRYYIYPIENNSDEVYHWTFKVLWFMFLLCAVICICSSAVFLWWKRQNSLESKQIMNVEFPTPTRSPGSWIYGSERELESLPHQSLVQATNVHFGARPDLKKILFECKDKDIGVLVSGPRSMRHEVGKICASGLADNLHFESFSFTCVSPQSLLHPKSLAFFFSIINDDDSPNGNNNSNSKTSSFYICPNSGFVKEVVTFMVMHDLDIQPMSTIKSNVITKDSEVGALQEKVVQLGITEGINMLKASLESNMVLTTYLQMGIWWFSVMIFVGYLMVWIVMPTNIFFPHWFPDIQAKADSIYFGRQGTTILIYTFPILLIATLASLYFHLEQKRSNHNTERWEVKLEYSALALGIVGYICLALLFFPVTRGSSILRFIGLTSEGSIKYHIWLGHIAMTLFTAHGLGYIIFWGKTHQILEIFKWNKIGVSNVAGAVSLLAGLILWAATLPSIRRKAFELFFYTHYLYIVFVIFFVFHVGFSNSCIVLPGFYLFMIDRYLRFLQSQQKVRLVSARVLPCETVELNFAKNIGLCYAPTSTIFINVPSISKLQWHPFTISSCSDTDSDTLSIVIKSSGTWSNTLYQKLSSSIPISHLDVSVEGPYGPASTFYSRHELLVLVSGGSGITPFISIIRSLIFKANTEGSKTPRVLLVCAFKKSIDLTTIDLILPVSATCTAFDISRLQLQIEAYVTREKQPDMNDKKLIQTLWFKPNALDEPVSAVLGQNSWLYLSIIISSSFMLFLLLIAILTRYYIYPIDHNTDMIYPYFSRSSLSMLFICISIAFVATSAFLWNKKQNKDLGQIKNIYTSNSSTSPGSGYYNADRELGSLPLQSLVQTAKVHYGERPNIKKILSGCNGSSIGVLVSGPRKMRHEVASLCTSCSTDDLHFESLSFSW